MSIHSRFKFQGKQVRDIAELLKLVQPIDNASFQFLSEWFNDEDFVIVKTSGSTGTPKQIRLQKPRMVASAEATGTFFNCLEDTKALNCLSSDFIAGKMMWVRALTLGWDMDLSAGSGNPIENNNTEYDFSAMVPLQVEKCLHQLHQFKKLIVGGALVSNLLQEKLQAVSTQVYATYGMTETITHIAVKKLNHVRGESYFETLPNVSVSLDERGCLVINAPNISEESVVTNDLVKLHSDSTFEWLGRFDSIINSGGVKLVPELIERKLQALIPYRFFVGALPDERLGQKVILVVETSKENDFLEQLRIAQVLSKYEIPKEIYCLSEFSETASAKIDKKATLKRIC